jgi:methyl-accepting chemotaxis protein
VKWFYDLKIATKLLVSFGVVLLLTLLMGVSSILSTARVNQASSDLADNWMPSVRMAMELRGDISDLRRWELSHLLNDEAALYATYDQRINTTLAAIKGHREAYEKLISSPEEKALVTTFDQNWTAYLAEHNKMIALSAAGNKDEARALSRGASSKVLGALTDATTALVKLNIDGGDAASDTATSTYNTARTTSIVLLVLNIGIGLALAVSVARIVSAPLREAVSAASAVAEGDLTREIQVKSACETGQLMQALKYMTENLQGLVAQVRSGTDCHRIGRDRQRQPGSVVAHRAAGQFARRNRVVDGRADQYRQAECRQCAPGQPAGQVGVGHCHPGRRSGGTGRGHDGVDQRIVAQDRRHHYGH